MSLRLLSARGKSTFTEWVSTGTVIIKIISNTNITSTSGVMLISLITSLSSSSPPPKAMLTRLLSRFSGIQFGDLRRIFAARRRCAGNQVSVQLMGKAVEFAEQTFVSAVKRVVPKHRRNGDGQTKGRHDQGFTDRASHFIDACRARNTDAYQGVID